MKEIFYLQISYEHDFATLLEKLETISLACIQKHVSAVIMET